MANEITSVVYLLTEEEKNERKVFLKEDPHRGFQKRVG
jgi:hypothetical protein